MSTILYTYLTTFLSANATTYMLSYLVSIGSAKFAAHGATRGLAFFPTFSDANDATIVSTVKPTIYSAV